ncbi:CHAT domain-containing protein [Roseateles sp. DC23W]|uniref:CHAT domain-containing protein n=1 Tax=Pelomonas dachongensis TaxID=3299029 RepID=A0ABW7EYR0_9BURK
MRTVLSVDTYGERDPVTQADKLIIKVLRSPVQVADSGRSLDFNFGTAHLPNYGTASAVKARGQHLRDSLNQHPAIAEVLKFLDGTQLPDVKPIYVVLNQSSAELIEWETLWGGNEGSFVALDSRWPVGRMADPSSSLYRPPGRFELPIRVMLVISAYAIADQLREWTAFVGNLASARKLGLPLEVQVKVGDADLRDRIQSQIDADGLREVNVSMLDTTPARLAKATEDFNPHVLHFFCHGRSDISAQSLELAHGGDYADPDATRGSLNLMRKNLEQLATRLTNPWLLVINSCNGGKAAGSLNSLAHSATSAGFPSAVAMLEPVDAEDAYEFTSAFYGALFTLFSKAKADINAHGEAVIEWGAAMAEARIAIRDLHGNGTEDTNREWSLPALYVRGIEPFVLRAPAGPVPAPHLGLGAELGPAAPAAGAPAAGPIAKDPGPVAAPAPSADVLKDEERTYLLKSRIVAEWLTSAGGVQTREEQAAVIQNVLADVPAEYWPVLDEAPANG